jgi:hypothetical protein
MNEKYSTTGADAGPAVEGLPGVEDQQARAATVP